MKKIAILIILTVYSLSNFSQVENQNWNPRKNKISSYQGNISNKDFFNKSDFIFEGTPVSSSCFAIDTNNPDTYYTSIIIKVTEVYKGELKTGIVELIRKGGGIMRRISEDIIRMPDYKHYGLSIGMNSPQIFFCKKSNMLSSPVKVVKDNSITIMVLSDEVGAIIHVGCEICKGIASGKIVGLNDLLFDSKKELYEYIKQYKGIKIPENKPEKSKDGGLNIQTQEQRIKFEDFLQKQVLLTQIAKNNRNLLKKKKLLTATDLTLEIKNREVTGTDIYYFEFDIFVTANTTNTYFNGTELTLSFNTAAFGSSLANQDVTITKGTDFSDPTYGIESSVDYATEIFIFMGILNSTTSLNRTQLTTTTKLLHVKIKLLQNLNQVPSGVKFIRLLQTSNTSSYTNLSYLPIDSLIPYDTTYCMIPVVYNISNIPRIDVFNPMNIHAGLGEILDISGSFFGSVRGKVLFSNADDGAQTFLTGLDTSYIKLWQNDHIRVIVPSYVKDGYPNDEYGSACSGEIRIKTAYNSQGTSDAPLIIDYSIMNSGFGTVSQPFERVHLIKQHCDKDMVFTLHTNITNHINAPEIVVAIETALSLWSTRLGINLALERNTSNNLVAVPSHIFIGKNVIWFDSVLTFPVLMKTEKASSYSTSTHKYFRDTESNIGILSSTTIWDYTLSNPDTGKWSFYQTFLHEIGHIVSLEHVNTLSELMYYRTSQGAPLYDLSSSCNPVEASNSNIIIPSISIFTWTLPIKTLDSPSLAPTISIIAPSTIHQNATVTFTDLSSNTPTNWYWNFPSGVIFQNGTNANSKNPQVKFPSLGIYNVSLSCSNSCAYTDGSNISYSIDVVNSSQGLNIEGTIKYFNTARTPIYPSTVKLMNGTTQTAITTTDASGYYLFSNIQDGNYQLIVSITKPWSGVTATDALKIKRHVVGIEIFNEAIKWSAADANNSTTINSTDALKVQRRIAGLDASFARPDWNFELPTTGGFSIIMSGASIVQNMYALCTGDVNGSNIPQILLKHATASLDYNSTIQVNTSDVFELPIRISNTQEVGAMQLFIDYPVDLIDIVGVSMPSQENELIYNVVNGQLRIVWLSLQPLVLKENDPIVTLKLKAHDNNFTGQIQLRLQNESELANATGDVINTNLSASMIELSVASDINSKFNIQNSKFVIYPNPVKNTLNIETNSYTKQKFEITDIIGQIVYSSFVNRKISIDTSHLTNGLYFIKLFTDNLTIVKRFVKE